MLLPYPFELARLTSINTILLYCIMFQHLLKIYLDLSPVIIP